MVRLLVALAAALGAPIIVSRETRFEVGPDGWERCVWRGPPRLHWNGGR